MLARHATLVAERLQTHSGTRLAVQHLAAFIAHHIRCESKVGREASMDDRDDGTAPATDPFSPDPSGGFERGADDRRRLEHQFGLLREDFNLWFDGMLRLGGLSIDPDRATWSVLDVGCGEGLFTREIARRYPNAQAVGIDVDADAVAAAMARSANIPNVRFMVHDIRQPLTDAGDFDAAAMWLVLPYLTDRRAALANLAAVLRPGGVALLGNVPIRRSGWTTRPRPGCWPPVSSWSPGWVWPVWRTPSKGCCARSVSTTSPPRHCATRWVVPPGTGSAGTRTCSRT